MEIAGKVALVTGAGSGIGRATARALAAAGARVAVADIDEIGGVGTQVLIQEAGGTAVFVAADVARPHGIRAMFEATVRAFDGIDIVHNNAGIVSGEPLWPEVDLERLHLLVNVNLAGVVMGTREAVHALRRRGGGAVVNTASMAAGTVLPADPAVAATNAGVVLFTASCAPLAAEGIRVNAVLGRPTTCVVDPNVVAAAVLNLVRDDTVAGQGARRRRSALSVGSEETTGAPRSCPGRSRCNRSGPTHRFGALRAALGCDPSDDPSRPGRRTGRRSLVGFGLLGSDPF